VRCIVPRAIGRSLAAARKAIRQGHCTPGNVRQARSAQARGRVIAQSRKPGASLPVGSRVNLVLSAGRPFVAPPFTG
jgi:beta-lactam-binding protein with PASTA domain